MAAVNIRKCQFTSIFNMHLHECGKLSRAGGKYYYLQSTKKRRVIKNNKKHFGLNISVKCRQLLLIDFEIKLNFILST